jgi:hypothetical protein
MSRRPARCWTKASSLGVLSVCVAGSSGCHSAFVETTIDNQSASPVRLVEVDYPSASFGVSSIETHSKFRYRFKIQGSGPLKIEFTDADGKLHNSDGPILIQGQEGTLGIVIQPSDVVSWQPSLTRLQ